MPVWPDLKPNTAIRWPRSITSLVSIRHLHDSGNSTTIRAVLAALAALFNRLGHYEPAATISGFADMPYYAVSRARRSAPG